jgi:ATP-binding protein involved in chromosome partitioning
LGVVREARAGEAGIAIAIQAEPPAALRERLDGEIRAAIARIAQARGEGPPAIAVTFVPPFTAPNAAAKERAGEGHNPLPLVRRIVAVGAGKGGVGKSTVATLLAVGLARRGAAVGLLDGDIYGPSMPTMLGLDEVPTSTRGQMLMPFEVHGIKAMTIGKLVDPDKALIWRGPMAHGAFKQLAVQTEWGPLDELIIDLPPGTGDVSLTMAQLLPLSGAVVVCTPQRVAADDARRAIRMFQQLGIEVLGVVENMSGFLGADGTVYEPFGRGGAEILAQSMGVPFLGALPLHSALRENADAGTPLNNWEVSGSAGHALASAIDALCDQVRGRLALAGGASGPSLEIR